LILWWFKLIFYLCCAAKKKPKTPIFSPKTIIFYYKLIEKEEFRTNCQILFSSQNIEKVSNWGYNPSLGSVNI